jgi:Divergent InlB B-repeat domain
VLNKRLISSLLQFAILVLALLGIARVASAALLTITWSDTSDNEDGFWIERRIGTSGPYQPLVNVGSNVVTYTDLNLANGTTYCYRVFAFNSAGNSNYTNENCGTTPAASFRVTVNRSGTGSGTIRSSPTAINCGNDCSATYVKDTTVTLAAVAAAGSTFAGWLGNADCGDGIITVNADINCTATFAIAVVMLSVSKQGNGKIASATSGIDCGSACSSIVTAGSTVSLRATADPGFIFSGWSGACAGTGDCTITLSSNTTVTANFVNFSDKIGVYRPSTGEWFLDRNGSGTWEGCSIDVCAQLFTATDALPVVGDWNGSGIVKIGFFVPDSSQWFLDANGNGIWDGCGTDICSQSFGQPTDIPVAGHWTTAGEDRLAVFRPAEKKWHLDLNGNETLDRCRIDQCPSFNIYQNGDVPIVGDWTGRGRTQLGLFRPSSGQWFLNRNPNRAWNGCAKDNCISSFGIPGDLPVAGDWNGAGITKIGVFRPSTGEWFLDLNGNGKWDGPSLDLYVPEYGQAGDIPVIGRW